MTDDIIKIVITVVLTWAALALNQALVPDKIKQVLYVIIIAVGVIFLITPVVDVVHIALSSVHK